MKAKAAAVLAGMLAMMIMAGCGDQVPVIDTVYVEDLDGLSIQQIGVEVVTVDSETETEDDVYVAEAIGSQAE
ncbi:MAG: hypothetical protein IKQ27_13475 [Lachnospiraceae bacterium]|nr:hypothetical protein [Lachnospiraceae bacterium]MBR6157963.1 hypothetical protein [Lachnospiraceae bacterium]